MGWDGESPIVVYDWDSLAIRTEPTIVGAAATVFASTTGRTARHPSATQRRSWTATNGGASRFQPRT